MHVVQVILHEGTPHLGRFLFWGKFWLFRSWAWLKFCFRCWSVLRGIVQDLGPQWVYLFDNSTSWSETRVWRPLRFRVLCHKFFLCWKKLGSREGHPSADLSESREYQKAGFLFLWLSSRCLPESGRNNIWDTAKVCSYLNLSNKAVWYSKNQCLTHLCLVKKCSCNSIRLLHLIKGREYIDCNCSLWYLAIFVTWATSPF